MTPGGIPAINSAEPAPEDVTERPLTLQVILWMGKVALAALILGIAIHRVPLAGLRGALMRLDWIWVAPSVIGFVPAIAMIEALRFHLTGRLIEGPRLGFRGWLEIYLESRPFFYLLPAAVGTEGLIWRRLRQSGWPHGACGFIVLVNRVWGFGAWCFMAAVALGTDPAFRSILIRAPRAYQNHFFWSGAGVFLILISALAAPVIAARRGIAVRSGTFVRSIGIFILALAGALVSAEAALLASKAVGLSFSFTQSLGLLAFLNFSMILPFSLGGIGIQEAVVLTLGTRLGFPSWLLVAFSAVLHLQRLALCGVGLLVFLRQRR